MVKKEDFFKCFSGKLKKFLLEQGNDYIMKAKDCKSDNVFWLFEKTNKLDGDLRQWRDNNPSYKE
jgi:hypothetical protein